MSENSKVVRTYSWSFVLHGVKLFVHKSIQVESVCIKQVCFFIVEMSQAVKAGTVPKEMIQRFVDMSNNPLLAWLMTFGYACY